MKSLAKTVVLLLCATSLLAQWSNDPAQNLKVASGGINHQICTDGNGGAYIAWETGAPPNRRLLRIQRLDRFGVKQFPEQGLPIRMGEFDQANLKLFEDGSGGAIVVFNELLPVADTLLAIAYAQRIDSTGTRLWGDSAVVVSPSAAHQIPMAACGDGMGGALIFWSEDRDGDGNEELYGTGIDAGGGHPLGENGLLIVEARYVGAEVVSTATHAILSYNDNAEVLVQKFDNKLTPLWQHPVNLGFFTPRKMAADRTGGVVMTSKTQSFFDQQPFFKLWAQRIDSLGNIVWNDGVVLADSVKEPTSAPQIASTGQSYYFVWNENPADGGDTFAQLVNKLGTAIWERNVHVSKSNSIKAVTDAVISSSDDVIIVWHDNRNGQSFDLYGQLLDKNQDRFWGDSDVAISIRDDLQLDAVAVSDGRGGAIIAWNELGAGTGNGVFAQQVSRDGKLGDVIVSVREQDAQLSPSSF
ncbi:hypothetical protein D6833_00005, partial [Candidatus Parcubacteria bacterium]